MSSNWPVSVLDGRTWYVGAQSIFCEPRFYHNRKQTACEDDHVEVIVPLAQLDGLTAEQIGNAVISLIPMARACGAQHVASAYENANDREYQRHAPDEYLESMIFEELPLLEKYRSSEFVDQSMFAVAIDFIREMKGRYEARQLKKQGRVHPARKIIAQNYSEIFMLVGRRDGFHCGKCKVTKNLHIDHVKPVSWGGTSDPGNLQLLCGSCNSTKSDKTIDYRSASSDEKEPQAEPDIHVEQPVVTEDLSGLSN